MNHWTRICLAFALGWALSLTPNAMHAQKKPKSEKEGDKKGGKASASRSTPTDPRVKERIDYLFIEANTLCLQEKKTEAIALYKELLGLDPKNHAAMYGIGKLQNELKNPVEAAKYCKQALDLAPENYWYYTELASAYQAAREPAKALEVQQALVKRFPDDKNGLYDLAQLLIQNKNYSQAVEVYDHLEQLTGANQEIAFRKHQLYMHLGQPEKAMAEIDKLLLSHPEETRYWQAKYDMLMIQEKEEAAIRVLEQLIARDPDNGFALLALADYFKAKGQFQKSDEYLLRAFDNPEVQLELKVQILGGMYPHAEGNLELQDRMERMSASLLKLHPKSALVHGIRGDVLQANGKLDSARTAYRKSLEIDPSNEQVWSELLIIDSEQNELQALQKDSEKALEYFPNQVAFLYFFGVGSLGLEDYEEAIYAFEKIKKTQVNDKNLLVQTYLSLAECYHHQENFAKSDETFDAVLKLAPGNATALNNYAYYLSLRGERLEDASKMVQQALQTNPGSGAFQDTYGWILFLQGDYRGAEQWIGKAVIQPGAGEEVLEHYGDTWAKLNDMEKAKEWWKKAIDLGAKFTMDAKLKAFAP